MPDCAVLLLKSVQITQILKGQTFNLLQVTQQFLQIESCQPRGKQQDSLLMSSATSVNMSAVKLVHLAETDPGTPLTL